MDMTIGMSMAVAPMLLMKEEKKALVSMMVATSRGSLLPAMRIRRSPSGPRAPVLLRAALITNMAATVITAGLAKPENACSAVTRPVKARVSSTIRLTRSMRTQSVANKTMAASRMSRTRTISMALPSQPGKRVCSRLLPF